MTLERYNKILGAVLGTGALLGVMGLVLAALVVMLSGSRRGDPRVLLKRDAERAGPASNVLYFCAPIAVDDTVYQLLPLAAINPRNPNDPVNDLVAELSVTSRVDRRFQPCGYGGSFGKGRIFDVILRDTSSGKQSLLWNRPALIDSFIQATEDCRAGKGTVPCGMRQWLVRDADTNGNGAIDHDDILVSYEMTNAGVLKRITPADSSILEWTWDRDRNTLLYTVAHDSNGDGQFTLGDRTDVLEYLPASDGMAVSIVDPEVTAQLLEGRR